MYKEFTDFEKTVIERIIKEEKIPEEKILLNQFKHAFVRERTFTGVSFYTNIFVPEEIKRVKRKELTHLGSIIGEIEGVKNGVDFILFLENGFINLLECVTYGSEKFPNKINKFTLYSDNESNVYREKK